MILQRRITSRSCLSTPWDSTNVYYSNAATMRASDSMPPSDQRILTPIPQTSLISTITNMESTTSHRSPCNDLQQNPVPIISESHTNILDEVLSLVDLDDFDNMTCNDSRRSIPFLKSKRGNSSHSIQ